MYFQFLIEDASTEILIGHVMKKLREKYPNEEIQFNMKSFSGIGHLPTTGSLMERKGKNLLNNLYSYLRGFDRALNTMKNAAIVIVLDNDTRDVAKFKEQLDNIGKSAVMLGTDWVFCVAVKEMEAWLLGDENAIQTAYPDVKKKCLKEYQQDEIDETWEVLANAVYPGGLTSLKKKAKNAYSEIGKAKCEWADRIGERLDLNQNKSPSFQKFIKELKERIEVA